MAGPLVRYRDGRVQITAHRAFPTWWTVMVDYCLPLQQLLMHSTKHPLQLPAAEHRKHQRVAHVTGVCLYVRRTAYERVGGFDPAYIMYLEETDWQRRLSEAGQYSWIVPEGSIVHFGSAEKTFAQASPHYLLGVALYAQRWWRGPFIVARLQCLWWASWLLSMVTLFVAFLPSLLVPQVGRRVRHYLSEYMRLATSLIHFTAPQS